MIDHFDDACVCSQTRVKTANDIIGFWFYNNKVLYFYRCCAVYYNSSRAFEKNLDQSVLIKLELDYL